MKSARAGMGEGENDLRLRREALQIVLQLPADMAEALMVLKYAGELVQGFLAGSDSDPKAPPRPPLRLV